ncbi:MAG: hypothetical protein ACTSRI_15395 [Promethearchaeota archaeon]
MKKNMTIDPHLKQELKEYLDNQIEEKVKSIQIKYLKEHFLTKEEFLDSMDRMDKRFEAMQEQIDKRFETMQEQIDKRFETMQEQIDKRFETMQEQIDKRFETMQKQMESRFTALQNQMNERFKRVYMRLDQLSLGPLNTFEGMAYAILMREFRIKGMNVELKTRGHFTDEENIVFPDSTDVEIDIYHVEPNIIAEVTAKLYDLDKIRKFIRKIKFIEKWYNKPFEHRYFIAFYLDELIETDVNNLMEKYNIQLIVSNRNKDFD